MRITTALSRLFIAMMLVACLAGTAHAQVSSSDLVAWWEMDDTSDSATAGSRPLILKDGALLLSVGGDGALVLDPDPDNNRATTNAFNPTASFSVVIDFQADTLPSGGSDPQYTLLSNVGDDAIRSFPQFQLSPGYLVFLRPNAICSFQKTAGSFSGAVAGCLALPNPTGRHVVVVNWEFSGGQFTHTLYLDGSGSPFVSSPGPMDFSGGATKSLILGTNVDEAFQRRTHDGSIFEAAIFDGTLSPTQVDAVAVGGVAALLGPTVIEVNLDAPSRINSRSRGVVPVVILSTDDFDATLVNGRTVRFGALGTETGEAHSKRPDGHLEDVDHDGDLDLVLHFATRETGLVCGSTEAKLTGEMLGGTPIEATSSIVVVGC